MEWMERMMMINNINCKYYQIDELKKEIVRNGKFSLLHLNIAYLGVHKDEFEEMLLFLDLDFDILGLTETRIIKEHLLLGIRNISHKQNQRGTCYISIKILKVKNVLIFKRTYIFPRSLNPLLLVR